MEFMTSNQASIKITPQSQISRGRRLLRDRERADKGRCRVQPFVQSVIPAIRSSKLDIWCRCCLRCDAYRWCIKVIAAIDSCRSQSRCDGWWAMDAGEFWRNNALLFVAVFPAESHPPSSVLQPGIILKFYSIELWTHQYKREFIIFQFSNCRLNKLPVPFYGVLRSQSDTYLNGNYFTISDITSCDYSYHMEAISIINY